MRSFYVNLVIAAVLVALVAVLLWASEPNLTELKGPVAWLRVSGLALAPPPAVGGSGPARQPRDHAPTRLALAPESLPYVTELRLGGGSGDKTIWQPTPEEAKLASLTLGKLLEVRGCDELSVYVGRAATGAPATTVTLVAGEGPQRGLGVCGLDLGWGARGRVDLSAGTELTIALTGLDRARPLLRYLAGTGLEVEFSDAGRDDRDARPFAGRRIALSASQVVVDRLAISPEGPVLDMEAQISNPDDVTSVVGPYRLRVARRWGLKVIAPTLGAVATALALVLSILDAHGKLAAARSDVGPRSRQRRRLWRGLLIVLVLGLGVFLTIVGQAVWTALRGG